MNRELIRSTAFIRAARRYLKKHPHAPDDQFLAAAKAEVKHGKKKSFAFEMLLIAAIATIVFFWFAPPRQDIRRGRRSDEQNNLRWIALAMHNYHDAHGHFPPRVVYDNTGKPMHSWRVLILPYMDMALFDQYDLDEPWDGPNNIKLIDQMPEEFRIPTKSDNSWFGRPKKNGYTRVAAISGPGTVYEGAQPRNLDDFKDGWSSTVLLTQIPDQQILWTEPSDILASDWIALFRIQKLLSPESRFKRDGLSVAFADGSVHWLGWETPPETTKALSTIDADDKATDF